MSAFTEYFPGLLLATALLFACIRSRRHAEQPQVRFFFRVSTGVLMLTGAMLFLISVGSYVAGVWDVPRSEFVIVTFVLQPCVTGGLALLAYAMSKR
jgi:hypothetical protein